MDILGVNYVRQSSMSLVGSSSCLPLFLCLLFLAVHHLAARLFARTQSAAGAAAPAVLRPWPLRPRPSVTWPEPLRPSRHTRLAGTSVSDLALAAVSKLSYATDHSAHGRPRVWLPAGALLLTLHCWTKISLTLHFFFLTY